MKNTEISWCHHTFNPWWGCQKVSPGCVHCYAERLSKSVGSSLWGETAPRRFFGEKHWNDPLKWNAEVQAEGERKRVFCASMADVFEDRADLLAPRARLFRLIEATPNLDWLLLSKRPENFKALLPASWGKGWDNVWLGVTVENQQMANKRTPLLQEIPAAVRFLSCEPLLGVLTLELTNIHWVICGGESGYRYRPMKARWAAWLRDQCIDQGVPFHFKQWGTSRPKESGRLLDGRTWDEFPTSPLHGDSFGPSAPAILCVSERS